MLYRVLYFNPGACTYLWQRTHRRALVTGIAHAALWRRA